VVPVLLLARSSNKSATCRIIDVAGTPARHSHGRKHATWMEIPRV
jgi:hypothetical protein